jgi:hypothetical protein
MLRKSPDGTMSINSVKLTRWYRCAFPIRKALTILAAQEINVKFIGDPLVRAAKMPIARMDLEESERKPTESPAFFSKTEEEITSGGVAGPRCTSAYSDVPSVKACTQFSAKCYIYSAHVTVSAAGALEKGLESATKKKPPKDFSFQMVFVSRYP